MASPCTKHPDWDQFSENCFGPEIQRNWVLDYVRSHDINQCIDEHGNTLLHHAVQIDNEEAIKFLSLLLGIDPNVKNAAGQTVLQLAQDKRADYLGILQNNLICIDFVQASSEPNGLEALFATIYRGEATLGDTFDVKNDGNEVNAGGWSALQCAVLYDRPHLIRALHERFPKLNIDYSKFRSLNLPLVPLAAMLGHSNSIIALGECFPKIAASSALQEAAQYNHPECIFTLHKCFPSLTGNEQHSQDYSPLMHAASNNNSECIRALHACFPDIDPNLTDYWGETALIAATLYNATPDCLPVLAECFPNLDPDALQAEDNCTALMYIVNHEWSDGVTQFGLYFPNADVNIVDHDEKTVMMMAIENNDENCLVALCESFPSIDPDMQDSRGYTALMIAICADKARLLMPQLFKSFPNMDLNIQNHDGETALMMMSQLTCPIESLCELIDACPHVDVSFENRHGDTALTLAIKRGNALYVAMLLERFPAIISTNLDQSSTILVIAINNNHPDVLAILLKHIIQICQD